MDIYIYIYLYLYLYLHLYLHNYMYIYIHICTYIYNIHICTYIYNIYILHIYICEYGLASYSGSFCRFTFLLLFFARGHCLVALCGAGGIDISMPPATHRHVYMSMPPATPSNTFFFFVTLCVTQHPHTQHNTHTHSTHNTTTHSNT